MKTNLRLGILGLSDGVALAAIQGLNEKLESGKEKTEIRVQQLEQRLEHKETEIVELKKRLEKLERLLDSSGDSR